MHATVEELLEVVFSIGSVLRLYFGDSDLRKAALAMPGKN
jgi:hypothetical protein